MNKETFDFVFECIEQIIKGNSSIPNQERIRRLKILKEIKDATDTFDCIIHILRGTPQEVNKYLNSLSREMIEKYIEETYSSNIPMSQKYESVKTLLKMMIDLMPAKTIYRYINK